MDYDQELILSEYDINAKKFVWDCFFQDYEDTLPEEELNDDVVFTSQHEAEFVKNQIVDYLVNTCEMKEAEVDIRVIAVRREVTYRLVEPKYQLK